MAATDDREGLPVRGWPVLTPAPATATDDLRRLLESHDIGDLTEIISALYEAGIEDPEILYSQLEGTEVFRSRFAGSRDPVTGELIASPAEVIEFERGLRETLSYYGISPERDLGLSFRAFSAGLIQNRRSLREVAEEIAALDEIRQRPFARQKFFALTGFDPGDEGILSAAIGLAPDLEKRYQEAVSRGVSVEEFHTRLERFGGDHATLEEIQEALKPEGPGLEALFPETRSQRLKAIRLAVESEKARFRSGGGVAVRDRLPRETF